MFQPNSKYFKEFGTSLYSPGMANLYETECRKSCKFVSKNLSRSRRILGSWWRFEVAFLGRIATKLRVSEMLY